MASLALAATIVMLVTILIGPLTYLLARLKFPSVIIYILSILCILQGIWFCSIAIPIWYIGAIPIYFGYISIVKANENEK